MFNTRATRAVPGMPVKMVVTVDGQKCQVSHSEIAADANSQRNGQDGCVSLCKIAHADNPSPDADI